MDRLHANQQLNIGQQLVSNNGRVNLIMQGDGNLVLYRTHFSRALWASNTWGSPVNRAVMQGDGNFVAYEAGGTPRWSSNTWGHPGAWVILQDDGNLVVYDSANKPLWASNTVQDFASPTIGYSDSRGYGYVETSESWKEMCQSFPCFLALQWPNYVTAKAEMSINGVPVVIQVWKGWCPKFLGLSNFPGGVGAEVGVYRRIPGRIRPTSLPFLPGPLASLILGALSSLSDNDIWWPAPELNASLSYTLVNPVNNTTFFTGGAETSYWLAKWMNDASYSKYQADQGKRWPWLPSWWLGNSNTPFWSSQYRLNFSVNGVGFTWQ